MSTTPAIKLKQHRERSKAFKAEIHRITIEIRTLMALSKKLSKAKAKNSDNKFFVKYNGVSQEINPKDINAMETQIIERLRKNVVAMYKADTARVKSQRDAYGSQFGRPTIYNDNLIQFFTNTSAGNAFLGYVNPLVSADVRNTYNLNSNVFNMTPINGGNALVDVLNASFQIFSVNHIANQNIIRVLFSIYAHVNNLQALATSNRGKSFLEWSNRIGVDQRMRNYLSNEINAMAMAGNSDGNNFLPLPFVPSLIKYVKSVDQGVLTALFDKDSQMYKNYREVVKQFEIPYKAEKKTIVKNGKAQVNELKLQLANNPDKSSLFELEHKIKSSLISDALVSNFYNIVNPTIADPNIRALFDYYITLLQMYNYLSSINENYNINFAAIKDERTKIRTKAKAKVTAAQKRAAKLSGQ